MHVIFIPVLITNRLLISGTEFGILNLQNQLQTREAELNKERKIRKQLEQHFEKGTEKRLVKELLPHKIRSTNDARNSSSTPSPSRYRTPISVNTGQIMNNNRFIHPSSSMHQNGLRVGAYF